MAATKSKEQSSVENAAEHDDFLSSTARTVGHAAGAAAKAIGLDHAAAGVGVPAKAKVGRAKTSRRPSTRANRKGRAEEAKSAAGNVFSKDSAKLGAPYRKVMGKPAANWSDKDIQYVNGLVAKKSA